MRKNEKFIFFDTEYYNAPAEAVSNIEAVTQFAQTEEERLLAARSDFINRTHSFARKFSGYSVEKYSAKSIASQSGAFQKAFTEEFIRGGLTKFSSGVDPITFMGVAKKIEADFGITAEQASLATALITQQGEASKDSPLQLGFLMEFQSSVINAFLNSISRLGEVNACVKEPNYQSVLITKNGDDCEITIVMAGAIVKPSFHENPEVLADYQCFKKIKINRDLKITFTPDVVRLSNITEEFGKAIEQSEREDGKGLLHPESELFGVQNVAVSMAKETFAVENDAMILNEAKPRLERAEILSRIGQKIDPLTERTHGFDALIKEDENQKITLEQLQELEACDVEELRKRVAYLEYNRILEKLRAAYPLESQSVLDFEQDAFVDSLLPNSGVDDLPALKAKLKPLAESVVAAANELVSDSSNTSLPEIKALAAHLESLDKCFRADGTEALISARNSFISTRNTLKKLSVSEDGEKRMGTSGSPLGRVLAVSLGIVGLIAGAVGIALCHSVIFSPAGAGLVIGGLFAISTAATLYNGYSGTGVSKASKDVNSLLKSEGVFKLKDVPEMVDETVKQDRETVEGVIAGANGMDEVVQVIAVRH